MSKLYFRFGTMAASKTANLLMTRFNYEHQGFKTLLLKPSADTRAGVTKISSRIGLEADAFVVAPGDEVTSLVEIEQPDVILCDECQFLTPEQIDELRTIVDTYDVPVFCYGLRTDFQTNLFPGSKRLFELADSISELKTVCTCGKKAIINARVDEQGRVLSEGKQIEIGGDDKYEAMCYSCYKSRK